ncbi:MAG TPA: hypothetical protein PLU82_06720 [Oscillospiraceae bacterium]|jgi:hypothetical protein|nr:hypothetical protein [Oscillospiraceae bacterium]
MSTAKIMDAENAFSLGSRRAEKGSDKGGYQRQGINLIKSIWKSAVLQEKRIRATTV